MPIGELPEGRYECVHRFFETPHDAPPMFVMLLTAYLDESRHENPNNYMAIAGFLGSEEQWKSFIPDWKLGLGKRKSLHMKELRWNKVARISRLLSLLGHIPYNHGLKSIFAAVRPSDYLDLIRGKRYEREMKGYYACLSPLMIALAQMVPGQHSIKLVMEAQKEYQYGILKAFNNYHWRLARPERVNFSSIEFIRKDSSILTQPADYLAFAITSKLNEPRSLKSKLCQPILGPECKANGHILKRTLIRNAVLQSNVELSEPGVAL